MCGIAGFLNPNKFNSDIATNQAFDMANALEHRGPDGIDCWIDCEAKVALAHSRLAILDLSEAGKQPMRSMSGRFVITFNGEIYNCKEIRASLKEKNWKGHSDTEILLASIEEIGLEKTLTNVVGMFALALWDCEKRELLLARDRMGEKPLYFGWQGQSFIFASELKAIRRHKDFRRELNAESLPAYMRFGYIPAPYSIYRGIYKLEPGSMLRLTGNELSYSDYQICKYWSISDALVRGQNNLFEGSAAEAVDLLDAELTKSVALQLGADVPVGAFLSGGIDSSIIVSIMQSLVNRPVKTFTIGFEEEKYNEATFAKTVAEHIGTDHHELVVTAAQSRDVIPSLAGMFDEPFGDSSAIPTYLLSKLAREQVSVSLSGDGGDELFAGYGRYIVDAKLWAHIDSIPYPLRTGMRMLLSIFNNEYLESILGTSSLQLQFERVRGLNGFLSSKEFSDFYNLRLSQWRKPERVLSHNCCSRLLSLGKRSQSNYMSVEEYMMCFDASQFLPDDILAKVDRASMSVGLETRAPFLSKNIVELSSTLPLGMKLNSSEGKLILKKLLRKYVPGELTNRPKKGFGVPVDSWLRGPLREWAEDLLSESELNKSGLFKPEKIRQRFKQHLNGNNDWQYCLWSILCFQEWYRSIHTGEV